MADRKQQLEQELRKQLPPQVVNDLFNPKAKKSSHYPNVLVTYLDFHEWLKRFDPRQFQNVNVYVSSDPKQRGLKVNVSSYQYQRDTHQQSVIEQLDQIWSRQAGKALQAEILASGRWLWIHPYVFWGEYALNAVTGPADTRGERDGTSVGMPLLDENGKPKGGSGSGRGTDAVIYYTASMWGPQGTSGWRGPGSKPDEVLFHEMVHASRFMKGVFYSLGVNQGYDNEEEYIAIVLSNIYLSELGQRVLRTSHGRAGVFQHPEAFLDNVERVNLSPRTLFERFRLAQRIFFGDLARIGPKWPVFNPVRQYDVELKVRRARELEREGLGPL